MHQRQRGARPSHPGSCYRQDMDADLVMDVLRALEAEGARYKVIGGVGLNLLGIRRFTDDLDIFIEPTPDNIARLRRALSRVFDDPNIDAITSEDLLGEYPAIQYVPPVGSFHIDIIARLGEAFSYDNVEASAIEFEGETFMVITPQMLHDMKIVTHRPQDHADAAKLREWFDIEE